jgi:hypothetical protein
MAAEDGKQDRVRLARVEEARVAREHLLDRVWVREQDQGNLVREPQGEGVTEAGATAFEDRYGAEKPVESGERNRETRSGRKGGKFGGSRRGPPFCDWLAFK